MTYATNHLLAATIASIGTSCLHAVDPVEPAFEVASFIVGMEGDGFVGNNVTGVGGSWEFPADQEGSYYVHSVDDTPIELDGMALSPLGGGTYGYGLGAAEVTDTTVFIHASSLGVMDGGDAGEFADTHVQVHGELHLQIDEPALFEYHLCNDTAESNAFGQIYIRRHENGSYQTVIEHITLSDSGMDCLYGDFEAVPGYYQIWFSSWVSATNQSTPDNGWDFASADLMASLQITAINIADINGDGKVDGTDLGRVLGAWGTSASGGDLNGDGVVDGQDLAIILAAWTG